MSGRGLNEERLGALLRVLQPAPEGWVRAAQELPGARRSLDEIVARAEADLEFRAALMADLEAALEEAGLRARATGRLLARGAPGCRRQTSCELTGNTHTIPHLGETAGHAR